MDGRRQRDRIARGRLLVHQAAARADIGLDIKVDASVAKVYATEIAGKVVDRCIQMFGGLGVAKEMPLERWYRELRIKRIEEGPSEVHRMVIARDILEANAAGQSREPFPNFLCARRLDHDELHSGLEFVVADRSRPKFKPAATIVVGTGDTFETRRARQGKPGGRIGGL